MYACTTQINKINSVYELTIIFYLKSIGLNNITRFTESREGGSAKQTTTELTAIGLVSFIELYDFPLSDLHTTGLGPTDTRVDTSHTTLLTLRITQYHNMR